MFSWSEWYARQERVNDLRREAEREHRAHQLLADHAARMRLNDRILIELGNRLIDWGCRLTERARDAWQTSYEQRAVTIRECGCPEERFSYSR